MKSPDAVAWTRVAASTTKPAKEALGRRARLALRGLDPSFQSSRCYRCYPVAAAACYQTLLTTGRAPRYLRPRRSHFFAARSTE
jgi:hypothetical protein